MCHRNRYPLVIEILFVFISTHPRRMRVTRSRTRICSSRKSYVSFFLNLFYCILENGLAESSIDWGMLRPKYDLKKKKLSWGGLFSRWRGYKLDVISI